MRVVAVLILLGLAALFWASPQMGMAHGPDHGMAMAHECPDCPDMGPQTGCSHGLACGFTAILSWGGIDLAPQAVPYVVGAPPVRVSVGVALAPNPPPPRG